MLYVHICFNSPSAHCSGPYFTLAVDKYVSRENPMLGFIPWGIPFNWGLYHEYIYTVLLRADINLFLREIPLRIVHSGIKNSEYSRICRFEVKCFFFFFFFFALDVWREKLNFLRKKDCCVSSKTFLSPEGCVLGCYAEIVEKSVTSGGASVNRFNVEINASFNRWLKYWPVLTSRYHMDDELERAMRLLCLSTYCNRLLM